MLLEHTTDIYDGVTVDGASLPATTEEFTSVLEASLEAWRSTGKKGVWLKVRAGGLALSTGWRRGGTRHPSLSHTQHDIQTPERFLLVCTKPTSSRNVPS